MKKGFTLLELIIVMVIIAILAVIAIPIYTVNLQKARKAQAVATLAGIKDAEAAYRVVNTAYTAGPTITADIDNDGTDDLLLIIANTTDFNYTVPDVTLATGYAQAARTGTTGDSYCMRLKDACTKTCAAAATCACATCP